MTTESNEASRYENAEDPGLLLRSRAFLSVPARVSFLTTPVSAAVSRRLAWLFASYMEFLRSRPQTASRPRSLI